MRIISNGFFHNIILSLRRIGAYLPNHTKKDKAIHMIEVIPKQSIGRAKLGLTIDQMRALFDNKFLHSTRNGNIDYFDHVNMEVDYYDDKAVYIGLNTPERAQYNGIRLGALTYKDIKELFRNSADRYGDYASLTFMDLGVGFYFEGDEEIEDQKPRQVSIFADGYYNDIMHTFERIEE